MDILRSSLALGYLTLEYEMFHLNSRTWDNGKFEGVSFAHALDGVRLLMRISDWQKRTLPPPPRMPFLLSSLLALITADGFQGAETSLSSNVYEDLCRWIISLEDEDDWGVDLPDN